MEQLHDQDCACAIGKLFLNTKNSCIWGWIKGVGIHTEKTGTFVHSKL